MYNQLILVTYVLSLGKLKAWEISLQHLITNIAPNQRYFNIKKTLEYKPTNSILPILPSDVYYIVIKDYI